MSALRRALEAAKRRAPGPYARARRMASLAGWYAHRIGGRLGLRAAPVFDEAFWRRNEAGDWAGFARAILRHAPAASALDVGCGDGKLLAAMMAAAPGLRAVGVDDSPAALERSRARGVDVRRLDLVSAGDAGTGRFAAEVGGFDVAISLEMVEHFPARYSGRLLRLLTSCAPAVVFSGAQPLQGGVLHVNERPVAHWIGRFGEMGYVLSPANDAFRADVRALDLPPWYAANVNLFVRG